jgi:cytochrome b subunit of formate dehydrogenase
MLPTMKDITDMWFTFLHNIGLRKELPKMPRFNFEEKAEYWALVWGTILMIITGFMLWNPIAAASFLPGEVIPAALAAHGGEALLAVLAIVFYHLYNVLAHRNLSIFSGEIKTHLVEEKHALEYEDIQAGKVPEPPPPEVYRKRMRYFVPFAVVMTLLLVAGLIWFVTFEQTAITTIPPLN